jgi:hypothetical protein
MLLHFWMARVNQASPELLMASRVDADDADCC